MYRSSKVRIVVRRWGVGLPPFQCAKGFPPIQYQFWAVIHKALKKTSLSHRVYGTHSFHFGEASKAVSFGVSSFNLKWLSLWGSKIYHSWDITSRYLWDIKVTSIGWTVWIAQWGTSQGWGGHITSSKVEWSWVETMPLYAFYVLKCRLGKGRFRIHSRLTSELV